MKCIVMILIGADDLSYDFHFDSVHSVSVRIELHFMCCETPNHIDSAKTYVLMCREICLRSVTCSKCDGMEMLCNKWQQFHKLCFVQRFPHKWFAHSSTIYIPTKVVKHGTHRIRFGFILHPSPAMMWTNAVNSPASSVAETVFHIYLFIGAVWCV